MRKFFSKKGRKAYGVPRAPMKRAWGLATRLEHRRIKKKKK